MNWDLLYDPVVQLGIGAVVFVVIIGFAVAYGWLTRDRA